MSGRHVYVRVDGYGQVRGRLRTPYAPGDVALPRPRRGTEWVAVPDDQGAEAWTRPAHEWHYDGEQLVRRTPVSLSLSTGRIWADGEDAAHLMVKGAPDDVRRVRLEVVSTAGTQEHWLERNGRGLLMVTLTSDVPMSLTFRLRDARFYANPMQVRLEAVPVPAVEEDEG